MRSISLLIDADDASSLKRQIIKRGRDGEKNISKKWLQRNIELHRLLKHDIVVGQKNLYCGDVTFFTGPMYVGKTVALIEELRRCPPDQTVCIINRGDNRYGTDAVLRTHDANLTMERGVVRCLGAHDILKNVLNFEHIGIDESQFFKNIVPIVDFLANCGKHVVLAGLNSTFARTEFPNHRGLIAICDHIVNMTIKCEKCGTNKGVFSKRINKSKKIIDVGSHDKYITVCRSCFYC